MAQGSTLLQPSMIFQSLLEKSDKTSIFLWSTRGMCIWLQLLPSWNPGTSPAVSCWSSRGHELQHQNTAVSKMHMSGRRPTHGHRRCGEQGKIPPASPSHLLVHGSRSSLLSPLLLAGEFQLPPLMAGKILAPCMPAACQEEDHVEMEEAIPRSTGTTAFACTFLETQGASSVFFQLSVNQSP